MEGNLLIQIESLIVFFVFFVALFQKAEHLFFTLLGVLLIVIHHLLTMEYSYSVFHYSMSFIFFMGFYIYLLNLKMKGDVNKMLAYFCGLGMALDLYAMIVL